MELILISNSKLKIMLDEDDMRQYRLYSDTDCAEPEARRAIRSILGRAKDEIGFNTDGEEVFVQLYTSRHGGCELFVTKNTPCERVRPSLPTETSEEGVIRSKLTRLAFSFESIGDLLSVCSFLNARGSTLESTAFADALGRCYLLLCGTGMSAYSRLDRLSFIYEFGSRVEPDQLLIYAGEHCRVICASRAIESLAPLK